MKPTRNDGGRWLALVAGEWQIVKVYLGGDVEVIGDDQCLDIDHELIWAGACPYLLVYGGGYVEHLQRDRLKFSKCSPPQDWCEHHRIKSIDG